MAKDEDRVEEARATHAKKLARTNRDAELARREIVQAGQRRAQAINRGAFVTSV